MVVTRNKKVPEIKSLSPGFKRIAENVMNSGKKKMFAKSKEKK